MHKKAMLAVAATVVMLFVAMTVQRHGIETQLTVYGQRCILRKPSGKGRAASFIKKLRQPVLFNRAACNL